MLLFSTCAGGELSRFSVHVNLIKNRSRPIPCDDSGFLGHIVRPGLKKMKKIRANLNINYRERVMKHGVAADTTSLISFFFGLRSAV